MSYGRIGQAELEARQRRKMEIHNKEVLRYEQLLLEAEKMSQQIEQFSLKQVNQCKSSALELAKKEILNKATVYQKACFSQKVTSLEGVSTSDIHAINQNMEKVLSSVMNDYQLSISDYVTRIRNFNFHQESLVKDYHITKEELIENLSEFHFEKKQIEEVVEKHFDVLGELMKLNEYLKEEHCKELSNQLTNYAKELLEEKKAATLAMVQINDFNQKIQLEQDAYLEYEAACKLNQEEKQELNEFSNVEMIQRETKLLVNRMQKQQEEDYINRNIHEVFEQFGYQLIDDFKLNPSSQVKHSVYQLKDSAVHVSYSQDHHFMMELVSLDRGNETKITEATKHEKDKIIAQKAGFCKQHPAILAELKKRGIVFANIEVKEDVPDHVKKITSNKVQVKTEQHTSEQKNYQYLE